MKCRLFWTVAAIAWAAALAACGVKTPPVPPKQMPPPHIVNLRGEVDDGRLVLKWSAPEPKAEGASKPVRFVVYRAGMPLSNNPCRTCPKLFERIADVPVDGRSRYTYRELLTPGFFYTFKVIGYSKNGLGGGDSNEVVVEY